MVRQVFLSEIGNQVRQRTDCQGFELAGRAHSFIVGAIQLLRGQQED